MSVHSKPATLVITGLPGTQKSSLILEALAKIESDIEIQGYVTTRDDTHLITDTDLYASTHRCIKERTKDRPDFYLSTISEIRAQLTNLSMAAPMRIVHLHQVLHHNHCGQRVFTGQPNDHEFICQTILTALKQATHMPVILDEIAGIELLDGDWFDEMMWYLDHIQQGVFVVKSWQHLNQRLNQQSIIVSDRLAVQNRYDQLIDYFSRHGAIYHMPMSEQVKPIVIKDIINLLKR